MADVVKTALEEDRVAIVDDATGEVVNVIVADHAWAVANSCGPGQSAHDVKGKPVNFGDKFVNDTFFTKVRDEKGELSHILAIGKDDPIAEVDNQGWAKQEKLLPDDEKATTLLTAAAAMIADV